MAREEIGEPEEGVVRARHRPREPGCDAGRADRGTSLSGAAGVTMLLMLCAGIASSAAAQTPGRVTGRIIEAGTNSEIEGATVELVGYRSTLTSATGTFLFEGVERGAYTLRVTAFGYATDSRTVVVDGRAVADVELQLSPIPIEPITVEVRIIEIEGRVRDAHEDVLIVDAVIFTETGMTRTDRHGRFRIESVPEGVPLPVRVQAFGYLSLDTVVLPEEDGAYSFELEEDAEVRQVIAAQVERMQDRVGMRWSPFARPINRDGLMRYAGGATMWEVLEAEYRPQRLNRVKCVVVDEQVVGERSGPIHNTLWAARTVMRTLLPEEVERVEVMAYGGRLEGLVVRVYTRAFMQRLIAGNAQLVKNPLGHDINCQ